MIPSPAVAAAISFPVSAVATGRRTAFEALYCRSSGLKLLVWTRQLCSPSRDLPAHLFGGARRIDRNRLFEFAARFGRPKEREATRLLRSGVTSSRPRHAI